MPEVEVYTTTFCPFCVMAKKLLDEKGVPFKEINLQNRPEELAALKERTGWRTVPQIFIGGELIGGYQELAQLDAEGKLDEKLS